MKAICGATCDSCGEWKEKKCSGCAQSAGCPFGSPCFIYRYIQTCGEESFRILKQEMIDEVNALEISGMDKIHDLYAMHGAFVNLAYPTPNGDAVRLLSDDAIYLCNQVQGNVNGTPRCYGITVGMDFLLVSTYGEGGLDPEIVIYKER